MPLIVVLRLGQVVILLPDRVCMEDFMSTHSDSLFGGTPQVLGTLTFSRIPAPREHARWNPGLESGKFPEK